MGQSVRCTGICTAELQVVSGKTQESFYGPYATPMLSVGRLHALYTGTGTIVHKGVTWLAVLAET